MVAIKRTLSVFLILGVFFALIFGCTVLPSPPVGLIGFKQLDDSKATVEGVNATAEGSNRFAIDYYNKIDTLESSDYENGFFFSPFSISTALAMTYEGADGNTAEEMQKVFYFNTDAEQRQASWARIYNQFNSNLSSGKYALNIANSIWPEKTYSFKESFLSTIEKYYYGDINSLDFKTSPEESRQTINKWVEERTNLKIKNLLPEQSIKPDVRMVLVNAIYFKANWESKFKIENTRDEEFYTGVGKQTAVKMMRQTEDFNYFEDANFQYVQMNYVGGKQSMLVILPKNESLAGPASVEEMPLSQLTSNINFDFKIPKIEELNNVLKSMHSSQVSVAIPKFKFETKYKMSNDLQQMGMIEAFTNDADFSKMDSANYLKIDQIYHKAFIAVDEEGTEAAAATAVVMVLKNSMPREFIANHPFAFAIIDNDTKMILFLGKIVDPSKLTTEVQ